MLSSDIMLSDIFYIITIISDMSRKQISCFGMELTFYSKFNFFSIVYHVTA